MRNVVVRLLRPGSAQRAQHWHGNASPKQRMANAASSVVVLFPERSRAPRGHVCDAPANPETVKTLAELEQENAELRRHVVDLALKIQELKADPADRHKSISVPGV
jgi:hypothetical protein